MPPVRPTSTTTRRTDSALRCRAVQAQDALGHRFQPPCTDRSTTRVADAVRPLVQLRKRSLGPLQSALERLADTDVGQAAHRLRGAVADPLAEAHGAAKLGSLCQHSQTLAITVPARCELSANRASRDRDHLGHRPYATPGGIGLEPDRTAATRVGPMSSLSAPHPHPALATLREHVEANASRGYRWTRVVSILTRRSCVRRRAAVEAPVATMVMEPAPAEPRRRRPERP